MNRKLVLVIIIIAGSVAVFGQTSHRRVQRYTLTGCRPAPPGHRQVQGGFLNNNATSLPKPAYPSAALAERSQGVVRVQVLIDEQGNVVSASAVAGRPLLRAAAVQAARGAKFPPTLFSGQPVKVSGILVYKFPRPPRTKLARPGVR